MQGSFPFPNLLRSSFQTPSLFSESEVSPRCRRLAVAGSLSLLDRLAITASPFSLNQGSSARLSLLSLLPESWPENGESVGPAWTREADHWHGTRVAPSISLPLFRRVRKEKTPGAGPAKSSGTVGNPLYILPSATIHLSS